MFGLMEDMMGNVVRSSQVLTLIESNYPIIEMLQCHITPSVTFLCFLHRKESLVHQTVRRFPLQQSSPTPP